jgi:outer membrane protein, multidrug efflux system
MIRFVIPFLILCLTGCMLGPDYQRPTLDIPESFHYEEMEARDTVNTEWWRQFQDPVLDSLIAEALANNKSVKVAAANVEQAAGLLMQTRAPLFPQVNYSGEGLQQRLSDRNASPVPPTVANPQTAFQLLAGASWEIDLWGRIRRLTEAAQANLLANQEARRGVILSLVASVASTHIQLRGLDYQLEIAKRTLNTYAESVRLFELQFKYGQVAQMNVEQARSQYETAAAEIPQIESQIAQTENSLCILLGRNPGKVPRGKSIFELSLPDVPAGLPSELLMRRPDLAQAEQDLIAANAQIGAAKALYFPTISLTGNYGRESTHLSDLFRGPSRVWQYTGSFTGPIFTGGTISGQVRESEANQQAALQGYLLAVQSAFGDVENSLVSRRKLSDQVEAQKRLVSALQNYDRLAWLQYNAGYTDYLTVLDAEQQLFPAELNYAQVRAELLSSYVNIYKAMGGGWVAQAEKATTVSSSGTAAPLMEKGGTEKR